ncbi:GDP-mannose 4,6-dehydratase [uncultured Pseudodesulfovibrio sp.]|uniref:GDP-mannose 4,6-dehydratase n=1 Tax=uncultured Pseudodesulfovibrio sp. TaxID=2035858 RepID=UPI00374853DF
MATPVSSSGTSKVALITGITGQDGAYLAQSLLAKQYKVVGTTRSTEDRNLWRLKALGIERQVECRVFASFTVDSFRQLVEETECVEIYCLAAQSSVGRSLEEPYPTITSIVFDTSVILEALRLAKRKVKVFFPCSSEVFGANEGNPIDESTVFNPANPYSAARVATYYLIREYRNRYNLHLVIGFLSNHESPLRGDDFVTRKIVKTACDIFEGKTNVLELGNIDIVRDWGWAPEYVEAMWLMLRSDLCKDYIIATGRSFALKEFLGAVFGVLKMDWEKYIRINPKFMRSNDHAVLRVNPAAIMKDLQWQAKMDALDVAVRMTEEELRARGI